MYRFVRKSSEIFLLGRGGISSDVKRGQNLEAETEAEARALRPRPRPRPEV